ncbi:MAG: histidine phosphatase family protein [Burkholderiaceae bacterium]
MELILVRHALPVRSDISSDPELSAQGRQQSARLADWLAGERFDALFSSPMRRALETAEPLRARLGLPLATDERLSEFNRHSGAYVPVEELKVGNPAAWQALRDGAGVDMVAFRTSVAAALEAIIAAHPGGSVVVFCHGGVINIWATHILALPPRLFFAPGYTSINRFQCSRSGHRSLVSLNETAHLRGAA